MNELKQPDTSTMEGRHAVELASRKFRIQYGDRCGIRKEEE